MNNASIKTAAKRVSNREMRRRAQAAITEGTRAHMILLAVLAQKGGEVVVTQGTLDQIGEQLFRLDYEIAGNGQPNEYAVRMLVDDKPLGEPAPTKSKVIITRLDDEDDTSNTACPVGGCEDDLCDACSPKASTDGTE